MKGYLFTQKRPDVIADNGTARRQIGVIATSQDQARQLLADRGIEGADLVESGLDIQDRLHAQGMKTGEVRFL